VSDFAAVQAEVTRLAREQPRHVFIGGVARGNNHEATTFALRLASSSSP
jgi:hypothetical protein